MALKAFNKASKAKLPTAKVKAETSEKVDADMADKKAKVMRDTVKQPTTGKQPAGKDYVPKGHEHLLKSQHFKGFRTNDAE